MLTPSDPATPAGSAPPPAELAAWTGRVLAALGLSDDDAPDAALLLDLTRQVAHQVTRTAGPLTCYLVGVAAARRGGTPQDLAQAVAQVRALVAEP
ncbi:MAG: DUF6457 domain-containing protein [Micrococcales bacterium]|nr:DUF6457 domain-containing protein [Micrococcales bacterium]